jgi:hypothetical protein
MKMLSMKRPRPSIEISTPAVTSLLVKASEGRSRADPFRKTNGAGLTRAPGNGRCAQIAAIPRRFSELINPTQSIHCPNQT